MPCMPAAAFLTFTGGPRIQCNIPGRYLRCGSAFEFALLNYHLTVQVCLKIFFLSPFMDAILLVIELLC